MVIHLTWEAANWPRTPNLDINRFFSCDFHILYVDFLIRFRHWNAILTQISVAGSCGRCVTICNENIRNHWKSTKWSQIRRRNKFVPCSRKKNPCYPSNKCRGGRRQDWLVNTESGRLPGFCAVVEKEIWIASNPSYGRHLMGAERSRGFQPEQNRIDNQAFICYRGKITSIKRSNLP